MADLAQADNTALDKQKHRPMLQKHSDDRPMIETPQSEIGLTLRLDESIIDRLPKENTKQGLSENTKKTYKSAIRDYNQFLAENSLSVSQESLKLYFGQLPLLIRRKTKSSGFIRESEGACKSKLRS